MKKVLLVEDDPSIQDNLNELLTELDFNVEVTSNGIEALKKLESYCPDIIISDVRMPKMDGIEFRKEILKKEETQNLPFIYISATNKREYLQNEKDLGEYDLIAKPYKIKDIMEIIKKYGEF